MCFGLPVNPKMIEKQRQAVIYSPIILSTPNFSCSAIYPGGFVLQTCVTVCGLRATWVHQGKELQAASNINISKQMGEGKRAFVALFWMIFFCQANLGSATSNN